MTENRDTAQYREFASSRAALVTGASSGMGLHYAWQLAEYGYNVILVSNQREQLEAVAHEIAEKLGYSYQKFDNEGVLKSSHPHWVTGIYMDLSDPGSAERLFGMCRRNKIDVEVLINNAGIFFFRDIADCTPEKVGTILNLHVYTSTMLCRYFGEDMRRRKKGYILNMSSISTHTPFCGISLYTATKSYIRTMSMAFRLEMKEFGVRVMVVSPGAVATDLYNLPKNLQNLGIKLGIIYKPEKLVRNALLKLFYSDKKEYIPGLVNRLFKPIYSILPEWFKMWARKKSAFLQK